MHPIFHGMNNSIQNLLIMKNNKALSFYHRKPENYNCAQSILLAFQEEFNINEETILEFKALGGGRAPEGYCGALYSALSLDLPQEIKDEIETQFVEKARFNTCREIRKNKTLSCVECVQLAENLVNEVMILQDQE